jgi:hypothetical protein
LARNCPVGLSPPVDFSDRGAQVTHTRQFGVCNVKRRFHGGFKSVARSASLDTQNNLPDAGSLGSNRYADSASQYRDLFKDYFMND